MSYLDWKIEEDNINIREGAINLRSKVAENLYYHSLKDEKSTLQFVSFGRNYWRWQTLLKSELIFNKKIGGNIIEIGAGTGWCSALLSKNSSSERIYVLDYDQYSVEVLMPLVFKNLNADITKLTPVLGSYNNMKCPDASIDYIISIGAIHHSENLLATFKEAYRALKPGGILLASEHCHPNSYTIDEMNSDNDKLIDSSTAKKMYGVEKNIKAKDNSDHNYRICEFEAFAYHCGFDVMPYIFDINGEQADDSIFYKPVPYSDYSNKIYFPYFAKNKQEAIFDNLFLVLQKPIQGNTGQQFRHSNKKVKNRNTWRKWFN